MSERRILALFLAVFAACWFLPVESDLFMGAIYEALHLARWYAREHVLLCLVPAFFIAGAVGLFLSKDAVLRYLGPGASRWVAYPVAAASGTILAVCSCTVLPLFASIHKRGAGLGPASAFLYSGPAINILAIILTARVLGPQLGLARAVGAVLFAILIGLGMQLIFREEAEAGGIQLPSSDAERKPWQDLLFFASLIGILVFANWGRPAEGERGLWALVFASKWWLSGGFLAILGFSLWRWFERDELGEWVEESWGFAKQILPLLLAGVLAAGFLLGGPEGGRGVIPPEWIASLVGGSSVQANLMASVVGAFMYFATLTEVPILEGLLASGMGQGPALALLLAGPALSLPNMLVIRSVLGWKKTVVFVGLVVVCSTTAGVIYGALVGA